MTPFDQLIAGYLPEVTRSVWRRIRKARVHAIAVIGHRASGKTTLVKRMCARAPSVDHAPTIGEDRIGSFEYVGLTSGKVPVRRLSDFGGEKTYWVLWDNAFTRDRPDGIIFVLDHEDFAEQREALRYFVRFLAMEDRKWLIFKGAHQKAKHRLRVILFLINKVDLWNRKLTMNDFLREFDAEFRAIERLGIPVLHRPCSALDGTNVDDALREFFIRMLP